ncbi:MAG: hypothetical protein CMC70_09450 [Flavobacteriaceae bacterium]|nr:hypothetical protein [Flavobacteriaceae bacterium]
MNVADTKIAPQFDTEEEITNLADFLENGLYNPNIARYVPESVLSGNCIPTNDPQSQIDLRCN